ncbi:MAG: Ig-like domain-containing protein, partial [Verrucomicrobia subdivision 3 bacterium]|nr:Ig-like domain-containing protein [Limisphaerales bacterium]
MDRFFWLVVCLAAMFPGQFARGFSITAVTLSPSNNIAPGVEVQMTVNIVTPGQPPYLYAATQVYSNATGIHVDIFPSSGPLTAIGNLRETVALGSFGPGTYNYEVVLRLDPNYGPVGWGTRTNRGSFTVQSGSTTAFSTDFNSGLPPGTSVFGSAFVDSVGGVDGSGVLKLTTALNVQQGSFITGELNGGAPLTAFTATFKMLIGGGNGADGLSFNFANDLPDADFGEEGAGTGLTISFDTFDNGGGEAPAIDAKVGGAVIASVPGSTVFRTGEFVDVRIHVGTDGTLDVTVNGAAIFNNLTTGLGAMTGRFGFGARTGGLNDNHFIDDLTITTGQPGHPVVTSASPRGSAVRPDAAVVITIQDFVTQVNPASIQLRFDGAVVAPQVSKSGDVTTVQYDPPGLLAPGSSHSVSLTYSDNGNPVFTDTFSYSFTVADGVGPNGNFYEVVLVSTAITWPEAKAAADARTYNGVRGHLATITSAEEDMFLERLRQQNRPTIGQNQLWVGGSQTDPASPPTENWLWENDEGPIAGFNGGATYANWHAGEPNDYWGPATENYLAIGLFDAFGWNDDGYLDGGRLGGYIVEYETGQTGSRRLTLNNPLEGQQFVPGETIHLRATLNDTSEGPWRIEFFSGDQLIGASTSGQTFFWLDAWAGQHSILALATNPNGALVASSYATIQVGLDPATAPVVSVEATQWRTAEPCPTCFVVPGILTIRRTAPTNTALTVSLQIDGTAISGVDYEALSSSVTIPAGQRSVQLNLLAKDDQLVEGPEIVRVRIAPSPSYVLHCCSRESLVVIHDDEPGAPTARIDIVSPTNGARLPAALFIELSAMAVNLSNEVFNSEFYAGDQLVARAHGNATTRPTIPGLPSVHNALWTNPPPGQHVLTARAELSFNNWITSPPVSITIETSAIPVVRIETWPLQNPQAPEFCPPNADCAYPSFVVRRIGPTNAALYVGLHYHGTATSGLDYPSLPRTVTIPPGRDATFVTLVPTDDTLVEGPETVIARFDVPTGPSFFLPDPSASTATITIIDNDTPPPYPIVSIFAEDPIATEFPEVSIPEIQPDQARFRILRTGGDLSRELRVFLSVAGPANPSQDYRISPLGDTSSLTVLIPAGSNSVVLQVFAREDNATEGMETVMIQLEESPLLGPLPTYGIDRQYDYAVAAIFDRGETKPEVEIIQPRAGELFRLPTSIDIIFAAFHPVEIITGADVFAGSHRIAQIFFPIPAPLDGPPIGFVAHRFTWSQPPLGTHTLTVKAMHGAQTIFATSPPVNITVEGDASRAIVRIETISPIAEEDTGPLERLPRIGVFRISRDGPTTNSLQVWLAYSGTATPISDYEALPFGVTIPAGTNSALVFVSAIPDNLPEGIETVVARIFKCPLVGAPIPCSPFTVDPAHASATVLILDDPQTEAGLTITRPPNGAVFDPGQTILIEAVAIDLEWYINVVEFWDGENKIGVSALVFDTNPDPGTPIQHRFEWRGASSGPHVLTARATRVDGSAVTSAPVSITVRGDPPPPLVRIDATSPIAEETSVPFRRLPLVGVFTISRTGPTNEPAPVFVQYSGMATPGVDYPEQPSMVTIPPGAVSTQIRIQATPDQVPEGIETVVATISQCPPSTNLLCVTTTPPVDPAHKSATIFIREDGITDQTVTITRPTNGASFNAGETIVIEAVTVDLDGYLPIVEFFAGGQKVGASIINFFLAPPDGTPIQHRFEWRNAPVGPHVLTARAIRVDGSAVTSAPVSITIRGDPPPLVRIDATSRIAEESSAPFRRLPLVGVFTISRTGPTNEGVWVFVHYSGMATHGVDYAYPPWMVSIPAGATSTEIRIEATPDQLAEGIETVVATLSDCPPDGLLMPCVFVPIDPAHNRATIFIREDGITDQTVTITRPTNGASFRAGEAIAIEAVTVDLNGYLPFVEFFAGDQK